MNCLFCNIIKKEIPSEIVDESNHSIAFYDINPIAPTHILVIPKTHIASTLDIDDNNVIYFSDMVLLASKIIDDKEISRDGYRWVVNTGKHGGQTVNHLHLHILAGHMEQDP